jgi:hypothetical protein
MDVEHDGYGIEDFCKRHGFSRAYLYLLWRLPAVAATCCGGEAKARALCRSERAD